jgi:hypothetical protein
MAVAIATVSGAAATRAVVAKVVPWLHRRKRRRLRNLRPIIQLRICAAAIATAHEADAIRTATRVARQHHRRGRRQPPLRWPTLPADNSTDNVAKKDNAMDAAPDNQN